MNPYVIPWMDDDLEVFRDTVVRFIETEMVPHDARWREQHHVDRETWLKAGETGLLCWTCRPNTAAAVATSATRP